MVVSLDCEFVFFVGIREMPRDIIASASEVKNTKAMLAFVGEMDDRTISWNLGLVGITLKTVITSVVIRQPFGGIGLQFFVGGTRFLCRPRTTNEFVGGVGNDAF